MKRLAIVAGVILVVVIAGTGYASAAAAVVGLPAVQTDHARLGYVTEIYTGGTFVPGTTTFTTSGVTATFTDLLPTAKLVSDTVQGGK